MNKKEIIEKELTKKIDKIKKLIESVSSFYDNSFPDCCVIVTETHDRNIIFIYRDFIRFKACIFDDLRKIDYESYKDDIDYIKDCISTIEVNFYNYA